MNEPDTNPKRDESSPRRNPLVSFVCTVGPAGHSPVAPGTAGALAALPFAFLLSGAPWWLWASTILALSALSIALVSIYLRPTPGEDPKEVVIDELVGCLIATAFAPESLPWHLAAFLLFRAFDILKPWPISLIDRRMKNAWGVMLDDIAAGLAAGGLLAILHVLC